MVVFPCDNELRLGVVESVAPAAVYVQMVTLGTIERVRFGKPVFQLLSIGFDQLNRHNPLHRKLLQELFKES